MFIQTTEAALPLKDDESVAQFSRRLRRKLDSLYTSEVVGDGWAWPDALFGDFVVVSIHRRTDAGSEDFTEKVPFSTDEAGAITLGERERVAVDVKVTFRPVSQEAAEDSKKKGLDWYKQIGRARS